MAFTKTPTQSTYDTKRFPLAAQPQQRNGLDELKDQRLLNCYVEAVKAQVSDAKKLYIKKRPGLANIANPGLGIARGIIYEDTTKKHFMVIGTRVFSWNGSTLVQITTVPPANTPVGFTVHLTTTVSVVLLTGNQGYVINPVSDTFTQIVSGNFPVPHLIYPQSMDGYLFVVKADTADIYNSDLDDPISWSPGNFITAEMYPDYIVALTKNNNYIIAVGSGSMEYYYDLGNASGSPLQRNESAVQQFGTPAPNSVVQTEKEIILVGSTGNGGRTVWNVEGFKADEIGTEAVRLCLDALGDNIDTINAYCVRTAGHKMYVLRMPTLSRTWVYDWDSKLWSEWSSTVLGVQEAFMGLYAADSSNGSPLMLTDEDQTRLVSLNNDVYQDTTSPIQMQFTTLKLDFDNMNRKTCSRLALIGDWPLNTTSTITVDWSDDDYRTWSAPRTLQLSTNNPFIRRLGRFRRRALRFTHTDNVPVRLEFCEMDLNMGNS